MALIKCPKCGKMFSKHAHACPQCGMSYAEIIKTEQETNRVFVITAAVSLFLSVIVSVIIIVSALA